MNLKPIIIVPGQPNSIFFEIFFKSLRKKKINSPILIICCKKIFENNARRFKYNKTFNHYTPNSKINKFTHKSIYVLDVRLDKNKNKKIQLNHNNTYVYDCFNIAFKMLKEKISYKFLNGPINKKKILNNKYLGLTEYISKNFNERNTGMLIYNKKLSVSPLTTHLPIKLIPKTISKKIIINKLKIIDKFYKKIFKFRPKIGVTGLNPHCESILETNEDDKIILPAVKLAKKNKILVKGPFAADTIFLEQNRKKFNVILGMYHDQVLTPIKNLFEYDAINITMGLPFLRVSPDHGPNEKMINKDLSNPDSLIRALEFLDKS